MWEFFQPAMIWRGRAFGGSNVHGEKFSVPEIWENPGKLPHVCSGKIIEKK